MYKIRLKTQDSSCSSFFLGIVSYLLVTCFDVNYSAGTNRTIKLAINHLSTGEQGILAGTVNLHVGGNNLLIHILAEIKGTMFSTLQL